ncbi:MAG TPA: hypothetical protein VF868_09160 [Bacteroidia bacterium]|jgi:hypothetical protein
MKQLIFCLVIGCKCASTFAQNDSIRKNHFSINLASGLISGEVGLYYDHRISDKYGFLLSYGHRFYNFNFIINGGSGYGYRYFPQTADIIRIGLKKYWRNRPNSTEARHSYFLYRVSAWNLHTPKYTTRQGSNGLNGIERSVVAVDKNVVNCGFGVGREISKKYLFMDLFASVGISAGLKKIHVYSTGYSGSATDKYYDNRYIQTLALFPTIELGVKIGL